MRPLLLAVVVLAMVGCPKPIPPTPVPPPDLTYPACPADMQLPTMDDACDSVYTTDAVGYACVNCVGNGGCVDTVDVVYCAKGGCLVDPVCKQDTTGGFEAKRKAVRQKLQNRRK